MNAFWKDKPWDGVTYAHHAKLPFMGYRYDGVVVGADTEDERRLITASIDRTTPPLGTGVRTFRVDAAVSVLRGDEQRIEDLLPRIADLVCRQIPGAVRVTMRLSEAGRQQRLPLSAPVQSANAAPPPATPLLSAPASPQTPVLTLEERVTAMIAQTAEPILGGERRALKAVVRMAPCTARQVQDELSRSTGYTRQLLRSLVRKGLLTAKLDGDFVHYNLVEVRRVEG
jgi:hypothetical protein